ncbi:Peroxisomal membrane signal receptor PTS1 [Boothiomyces macroporosus]|uniref:Peroxisomal membrane signal receptor PTS1 n=1 Tax=Boothiomyces macroporosus TaxID=261099 RepID=A0AAD5Y724_9FUNG|nr:Peroxisomal membrane signal receptor PTS1 [Boothiomyces macroporosus]
MDCSSSAINQIQKHFEKDISLQNDRIVTNIKQKGRMEIPQEMNGLVPQLNPMGMNNPMINGPLVNGPQMMTPQDDWAGEFKQFHPPANNWANEFHPAVEQHHFEQVYQQEFHQFEQIYSRPNDNGFEKAFHEKTWEQEFSKQSEWATEFKENQDWANEFQKNEDWAEEFKVEEGNPKDALAKTAAIVAQLVGSSENPKFKNSKFLEMMEKLRDGEVAVEGDKMVEQITPASSHETAMEFTGAKISTTSWEEDFNISNIHDIEQANSWNEYFRNTEQSKMEYQPQDMMEPMMNPGMNFHEPLNMGFQPSMQQLPKNTISSKETDIQWESEFKAVQEAENAPPRNWQKEFIETKSKEETGTWQPQYSSDVSHDMDWPQQFIDANDEREKELYQQDLANNLNSMSIDEKTRALKDQMDQMEASWREMQSSHVITDPRSSQYQFSPKNPYLKFSEAELQRSVSNHNLTESILALEAMVQKDPQNATAWHQLGKKQQENENEFAAISAFRKSIDIDPQNLDSYIPLAVSHTNENFNNEAYECLNQWLGRHPEYNRIPSKQGTLSSMERYENLIERFIQAAMSRPGDNLDPDVQTALGVLFNIGMEYKKAIDCFQSALSKSPDNYELWNKLGATLANSGEAEKALDAYFQALNINPSYIRARYNLAIACIQFGQYREAAGYLLGALATQEASMKAVNEKTQFNKDEMIQMHIGQSECVWTALRMLLNTYSNIALTLVKRDDLAQACDTHNLDAFRNEFEF